jgi:hypothetical protein
MKLRILNCPDKAFKPYLYRAAQFFARELITNTRIRNNCITTIKFDSKLETFGAADIVGYNSRKKAREFLIEVHPGIGARTIMETLAHEMVHVKQYAYGELDDCLSVWRGDFIDSDNLDYWIHPWEIEAHGRELGLVTKFATQEKLWEIFQGFKNPNRIIEMEPLGWKTKHKYKLS